MKIVKSLFVSLGLISFTACQNSDAPKKETEETVEQKALTPLVPSGKQDELMDQLDATVADLSRIESLIYSQEDLSSMEAIAYYDSKQQITKIEESAVEGKTGIRTTTSFYMKDGVRYASKRGTIKGKEENAYFSEEITFYDPNGKALSTKERTSSQEETINQAEYREAPLATHSDENAYQILKQQGHYTTTFQGFVESDPYHFLVVGENVANNGFTASLVIQEDSPTLRYLRKQGKAALGQELEVQFQRLVDEMGYVTQVLLGVKLIERKKY